MMSVTDGHHQQLVRPLDLEDHAEALARRPAATRANSSIPSHSLRADLRRVKRAWARTVIAHTCAFDDCEEPADHAVP
jgi:hypothetical protein